MSNILFLNKSVILLCFLLCTYLFFFLLALFLVCRLLDGAVDRLSKQIRGLTNLTLKITSTQPLSAISRHTVPFYPLPHPLAGTGGAAGVGRIPRCLEPTELLLQLEGSGMHPRPEWWQLTDIWLAVLHCMLHKPVVYG